MGLAVSPGGRLRRSSLPSSPGSTTGVSSHIRMSLSTLDTRPAHARLSPPAPAVPTAHGQNPSRSDPRNLLRRSAQGTAGSPSGPPGRAPSGNPCTPASEASICSILTPSTPGAPCLARTRCQVLAHGFPRQCQASSTSGGLATSSSVTRPNLVRLRYGTQVCFPGSSSQIAPTRSGSATCTNERSTMVNSFQFTRSARPSLVYPMNADKTQAISPARVRRRGTNTGDWTADRPLAAFMESFTPFHFSVAHPSTPRGTIHRVS